MTGPRLTSFVREAGAFAWCLGLVVIALDFLAVSVLGRPASLSYPFFLLAALLAAWAEKREFGTRVALYRVHDAVIYSPWKYLLLYFLWISVFAPFTANPVPSIVYAANGWLSLLTVAVTAQFLFCERGLHGAVLLPKRLRLAFRVYCGTLLLLLVSTLLHLFWPDLPFGLRVDEQANLFLYFTIGFPFLFWDLLKAGRRLLPTWLSFVTILLGSATVLLIGRRFYQAALAAGVAGVLAFFIYKQSKWQKTMWRGAALGSLVAGAVAALSAALAASDLFGRALDYARRLMEERMSSSYLPALATLRDSSYLGQGIGLSSFRGVWPRLLAEAGVVGFALYSAFFVSLAWELYRVRRAARVVVSNIALVSVGVFLAFVSHYVENPYGAYVWVWYSLWAVFAAAARRKGAEA